MVIIKPVITTSVFINNRSTSLTCHTYFNILQAVYSSSIYFAFFFLFFLFYIVSMHLSFVGIWSQGILIMGIYCKRCRNKGLSYSEQLIRFIYFQTKYFEKLILYIYIYIYYEYWPSLIHLVSKLYLAIYQNTVKY